MTPSEGGEPGLTPGSLVVDFPRPVRVCMTTSTSKVTYTIVRGPDGHEIITDVKIDPISEAP